MSSWKEREILERQKRLAAKIKPTKEAPPPKPDVVDLTTEETKKPAHKRPGNKRPSKQSAILAAARDRASKSTDQCPSTKAKIKPPPQPQPNDLKPSPKLKRKTLTKVSNSTSLLAQGTFAKLVQNSASGVVNDEQPTLQVHKPDDFWKNLREWDLPSQYYLNERQRQDDSIEIPQKRPLPNTFLNARHYVAAWAPLCMAECRAQLLSELTQHLTQPVLVQVKVTQSRARRRNDMVEFMDDYEETGGHVILQPKERSAGMSFQNNDLVLLLTRPHRDLLQRIGHGTAIPPNKEEIASAFEGCSLIGHTESNWRSLEGLIVKVSKRKWAKIGQPEMYLVKIGSNVTALREFTALCNVDTLPMKQHLLGNYLDRAENRRKLSRNQPKDTLLKRMGGEKLGDGFLNYVGKKFNSSQLTSIAAAAHEYGEGGFTLIKGPPGTGKTTTLVAVLNSLHIRQYNKYYEEVQRIVTKSTGSRDKALALARRAKPRLLVCAPSNAAIDNIILKIMEDGFIDGQGNRYNPSMIRTGVGQSAAVRDVSLGNKVDSILSEHSDAQLLQASINGYQSQLTRISQEIAFLRRRAYAIQTASPWPVSNDWEIRIDEEQFEQRQKAYFVNHQLKVTTYDVPPPPEPGEQQFKTTSMPEYRNYSSRIVKLVDQYYNLKSHLERCSIVKRLDAGANQMEVQIDLETHVLNSVHMVMTTLGSAGSRALEGADRFEVIVVDEAAQSVEPASLSALRLGSRHAVLVGDPQQLPATVFNLSGRNSKFDRSLFQRLEEAGQPVYMLNEQYRMHPKISHFPRNIFYGGALLDGPNVIQPNYGDPLRNMICRAVPTFSPFTILDLDSKEERGGTSLSNLSEAKLAVYLYQQLKILGQPHVTSRKVAVITPYAQQCRLLRTSFADLLGSGYEACVEVNTVDAFQGREANIVIFSAVRAAGSKGIGFLSDIRRMNVALTRAKFFLFVIARCQSVVVNPYWSDLVDHARETNAVVRVPMIGSGATASFASLSSWRPEKPSHHVGIRNSVPNRGAQLPPSDPRNRAPEPNKQSKNPPADPRKRDFTHTNGTPERAATARPNDPRKRNKKGPHPPKDPRRKQQG